MTRGLKIITNTRYEWIMCLFHFFEFHCRTYAFLCAVFIYFPMPYIYFFSFSLSEWVCAFTCNCHMRVLAGDVGSSAPTKIFHWIFFHCRCFCWVYLVFDYSSEFVLYCVCVRTTRKRACILIILHFCSYTFKFIHSFIHWRSFVCGFYNFNIIVRPETGNPDP